MNVVTMYTTAWCPFCHRAEQLLKSKGVAQIHYIRVDESPDHRGEMIARTGKRTVPQIFIGDRHVGGYDDLAASNRSGTLDGWLRASPSTYT